MVQGVVAVIGQANRLLVIRRSVHVRAPGAYCFPGGSMEPGESEAEALERELNEELAAAVRPVRRLWTSTTRWNVRLAWWWTELESRELTPQPAEVQSAHWLTIAEIRALPELLASNHEFLDAWEAGAFSLGAAIDR